MVARDGIEPPTPAFSGPNSPIAKLILVTALVASRAQSPPNQQTPVISGRYQLVAAPGLARHEGVYRIDTTTGQAWVVGIHVYDNRPQTQGWIFVEESGGASGFLPQNEEANRTGARL